MSLVRGIILLGILAVPLCAEETDPEVGGLRLRVAAMISPVEAITRSGSRLMYDATAAFLDVECALENISDHPIELPSRPENNAIAASSSGVGKYWVAFRVFSSGFAGKPTVVSPLLFFPVTLQPGESVRLPRYHVTIKPDDWRTARLLQQVKVEYEVNAELAHRFNWWSGKISATYPVRNTVGELHREEEMSK